MSGATGAATPGPRTVGAAIRSGLRRAAAVGLAGALGGIAWLVVMQEGHERGWTEHDFNQMLGQLFVDRSADVARAGLWGTLALGAAVALVYGLVIEPLVRSRGRWWPPLTLALILFLLWSLAFAPVVTAYVDTAPSEPPREIPGGPFGLDAGVETFVLGLVASLVAAAVIARVHRLAIDPGWWAAKHRPVEVTEEALEEILSGGSLELSEQRPEEGREPARG